MRKDGQRRDVTPAIINQIADKFKSTIQEYRHMEFKLKDLSYFTEEEVALLERIINNMDCSNELKDKGKEKCP